MKTNIDGFLLMQVMIVIFILSLLTGISASYFNYFDKIMVLVELDKLYSFIIFNSKIAVLSQQDLIINFDIINGSYSTYNISFRSNASTTLLHDSVQHERRERNIIEQSVNKSHAPLMSSGQDKSKSDVPLMLSEGDSPSRSIRAEKVKLCSKVKFGFLEEVLGPPAEPTKKITTAITFPKKQIILYKNGTINSGSIYLTDKNKKHLYALTSSIAQISSLRKYYYKNKWVNL